MGSLVLSLPAVKHQDGAALCLTGHPSVRLPGYFSSLASSSFDAVCGFSLRYLKLIHQNVFCFFPPKSPTHNHPKQSLAFPQPVCLRVCAEGGCLGGKETEGGEARCGCGPLTLVQGADTDKPRLVRQGSLPPLYTSLSPARLLSFPLMGPICLWLPACLTV